VLIDGVAQMSEGHDILRQLVTTIEQRRAASAANSYVAKLNSKGLDAILKKIGEEATEVVIATKDGDHRQIVYETADLWFHCLVMLNASGVELDEVLEELQRRAGRSGLEEKAARGA
jgi:phosphoribosyl-ATP pyrophosphohydrolase